MPRPRSSLLLALLASLALGGCAANEAYPSLALRPIETESLSEPTPRVVPQATAAPIADHRYAAIVADARTGDATFRRKLADARPALQRGRDAAVGSDAWGEAQQQLSRVQAARAPVVRALATLQSASEAPDTQADRGLADAALRALDLVGTIDAAEAQALAEATPRQS